VRFAVLADPHLYAPELGSEHGPAFREHMAAEVKRLDLSVPVLRTAFIEAICSHVARPPTFVLIPGDLTNQGERLSHELVTAGLLHRLQGTGRRRLRGTGQPRYR
jgi:3',5'-cyclic AMP phosphodiesterase CpdA